MADRGFDWRDAAIGAATAAAFIFVLAGGALLLNRRHTRLALSRQANAVSSPSRKGHNHEGDSA